jgi:inorganic triphosphatase YgiF
MEIELKFAVPDEGVLMQLASLDRLAGYALSAAVTKHVHDTFLDTPDRSIVRSGHTCRRREVDGHILMTLKGSGMIDGAIHRREELEIELPAERPVPDWPASLIRDRLLSIIGSSPLTQLFDQRQTRIVRNVLRGDRVIAELSLDRVELAIHDRSQVYLEIEVELKGTGTEEDLAKIAAYLTDDWGLKPEPRSKFSRGLALLSDAHKPG